MNYYIIAGEASGDLHASNLIRALKKIDPASCFRGFGGELMEAEGLVLKKHYREMAFMGFIPVLMNWKTIRNNFRICEEDLLENCPDVLILIDYPGFNLRMARFAHEQGIRVYYYIPPKIWAWKTFRIKKIKAWVDELLTILPFETEFYGKYGVAVHYVGNPVLDAVSRRPGAEDLSDFKLHYQLTDRPVIALLPGSRMQEISSLLPVMLSGVKAFTDHQIVITTAPNIPDRVYRNILGSRGEVKLISGRTYDVLKCADVAVLASGTVALEAAVIGCPQVVCYRMAGGAFFYHIGHRILRIKWVSLPNLIVNKTIVPELLQHYCSSENIAREVQNLLPGKPGRGPMMQGYGFLRQRLGAEGASERAASVIFSLLTETKGDS